MNLIEKNAELINSITSLRHRLHCTDNNHIYYGDDQEFRQYLIQSIEDIDNIKGIDTSQYVSKLRKLLNMHEELPADIDIEIEEYHEEADEEDTEDSDAYMMFACIFINNWKEDINNIIEDFLQELDDITEDLDESYDNFCPSGFARRKRAYHIAH